MRPTARSSACLATGCPARFRAHGTTRERSPSSERSCTTPSWPRRSWRFNNYQLQRGSLPLRWRELAILRVAHRRRSAYEWGQHVKIALDNDITTDEIDQLAPGNDGFDGIDRLVLEATDELLGDGRISDGLLPRLDAELDTHQMMDLVFIVGTYSMLAMAFETWRLVPESDTAPLPPLRAQTRCLDCPDVEGGEQPRAASGIAAGRGGRRRRPRQHAPSPLAIARRPRGAVPELGT